MQQEKELPSQTGAATYEGTRPWLERTGWITTYQGVPRTILKRMVLPPSRASVVHGLQLGLYQKQQLASPYYTSLFRSVTQFTLFVRAPHMSTKVK